MHLDEWQAAVHEQWSSLVSCAQWWLYLWSDVWNDNSQGLWRTPERPSFYSSHIMYRQYKIIKGENYCVTLNGRRNLHLVAGDKWLVLNELYNMCEGCPELMKRAVSIGEVNNLPMEPKSWWIITPQWNANRTPLVAFLGTLILIV